MLVMDGIRYLPHKYAKENELEEIVTEHYKDIFGEKSVYFPIKKAVKTRAGVKSVPDGYLMDFEKGCFYCVEIELASHQGYDHIGNQINKFIGALQNPKTRQSIASAMKNYVMSDILTKEFVRGSIGPKLSIYEYFLQEILERVSDQEYQTVVVVNEVTDRITEACAGLNPKPKIIELRTFVREDVGLDVHIHLFTPLFELPERPPKKQKGKRVRIGAVSQKEFRMPILESLIEMDGKGKVADVLVLVEKRMKKGFEKADYQKTESGSVRWKNRALFERFEMKRQGLLREDSPRGIWEITGKGRNYYDSERKTRADDYW